MVSGENGMFGRVGGVNETNGDSGAEWVKLIGGAGWVFEERYTAMAEAYVGSWRGEDLGRQGGGEEWVSVTKFEECRMMALEVA